MNQLTRIIVHNTAFQAAPFQRSDLPHFSVDFWGTAADAFYIYSPSDTPQGLRRGSVFLGWLKLACEFPVSPTYTNARGHEVEGLLGQIVGAAVR